MNAQEEVFFSKSTDKKHEITQIIPVIHAWHYNFLD
jgi:hypothetical protein